MSRKRSVTVYICNSIYICIKRRKNKKNTPIFAKRNAGRMSQKVMKLHLQGTGGNRVEGMGRSSWHLSMHIINNFYFLNHVNIFVLKKFYQQEYGKKTLKQNTNKINLIVFQKKNRTISKCVCWGGNNLSNILQFFILY